MFWSHTYLSRVDLTFLGPVSTSGHNFPVPIVCQADPCEAAVAVEVNFLLFWASLSNVVVLKTLCVTTQLTSFKKLCVQVGQATSDRMS